MRADELPPWFWRGLALALGAVWGSFGNVVIYRWPNELSVVRPGSHCPRCNKPVRAWDNVPVLAWLWLRGKCRDCKAPISPRYALVELGMALVSLGLAERVLVHSGEPAWAAFALYAVRFCVAFVLGVTAFIDLDEMIVPWFTKWFALVPLASSLLLPVLAPSVAFVPALAGAGLGYLGLRILFIDGYRLLAGRPGMGLGDAEVLLVVGALLGPLGVLFALCAGALQGLIAAGLARVFGLRLGPAHSDEVSDDFDDEDEAAEGEATTEAAALEDEKDAARGPQLQVPFVPFLALGALEYLLGGDLLLASYLRLLGG